MLLYFRPFIGQTLEYVTKRLFPMGCCVDVDNEFGNSVIANSALQLVFAAATGNFRSISALKSIYIDC